MSNSTFSQSADKPILNQALDGRFKINRVLVNQFCRRIYLAQDLHRPGQPECIVYHLQVLPNSSTFEEAVRVLLIREVDLLAELGNHSQIPGILACFESDKGFFVVLESIPGITLGTDLQAKAGWSAEQVLQFLQEILELLSFVHAHGGVHGNITPNAIVRRADDGRLGLTDFGSILQIQESLIAASGQHVPYSETAQQGYQPLEQLQGLPCPASDVYAIGIIAIQALTGVQPAQLKIDLEAKKVVWHKHYHPKSTVERQLVKILDTMIEWDLSRRYRTAAEALTAIQEVASSPIPSAPMVTIAATVVQDAGQTATDPVLPKVVPAETAPRSTDVKPDYRLNSSPAGVRKLDYRFYVQRLLFSALSKPPVLIGAGGTAATLVLAMLGWALLSSVGWAGKVAGIWERFQQPEPDANAKEGYSFSEVTQQWRKNWQTGENAYRRAEEAFNLGKWAEASRLSQQMPPIPYWQDRGKTLSRLAIARAETDANQLLQSAYRYAYDRDFTTALRALKQIPQETSVSEVAQRKIKEYSEKQVIKAWVDLQRAFDRAQAQDFTQALTYLWQIPVGTPAHEIAQQKIAEYNQKQEQYIKFLLQSASDQAQQNNLQAALTLLEKAPKGTSLDSQVDATVAEYTQQLNQQADLQLQQATLQAATGDTAAIIAALEKVPMGTVAYVQARDKIAEYTQQTASPVAQQLAAQQTIASQDLNPGSQLREVM
ncbi:serine/threonine protein kinase [Leptodesmis sp.]|uniref:serine/threonine protein kinase n=1 Tax=Leptodesmis sp. TaxID=3100501 RepID=UPI00405346F8